MKFRFTIGAKIGLGFGVIVILTFVSFLFTNLTIKSSKDKILHVTDVVNPSLSALKDLDNLLNRSKLGIEHWSFMAKEADPEKNTLVQLIQKDYPALKERINQYSPKWNDDEQKSIKEILSSTDDMITAYEGNIMNTLKVMEDYSDPVLYFPANEAREEAEISYINIKNKLSKLIEKQNNNAKETSNEMLGSFDSLKNIVVWLGIILVLGSVLIATVTIR